MSNEKSGINGIISLIRIYPELGEIWCILKAKVRTRHCRILTIN